MTADGLFRLCNSTALAGWLLLVATGWSARASRVISSLITGLLVPALLCGLYLVLIATHWGGHRGGFSSLSGVMLLFTDRWLVLAGWVHYLAFDLFIGSWQVRDARRNRVPVCAGGPVPGADFPLRAHRATTLSASGGRGLTWQSLARPPGSRDLAKELSK